MAPQSSEPALSGCRVLVIEDEYFLADDMAKMLRSRGAEVVGPVGDIEDALELLHSQSFHMAVLDINLKNKMIYPVADELRARAVPFIFVSGYDAVVIPEDYRDVVLLRKPLDEAAVATALNELALSV
jgi:CheY-like chemotaxis protein